ncbi:MAG TPA: DUF4396 domain-containing protein [Candidatus Thalassarchaeaceae archaeon]|nr:DUF4396 domain-containing protein [Candidatus Thalassarchaeaceae archaeon]
MTETIRLEVGGMTCDGCASRVRNALESVRGVSSASVSHIEGSALIEHSGASRDLLSGAIRTVGYSVDGMEEGFNWGDRDVWRKSANNTKWCLIGCSMGEFGTLAYYSYSGITAGLEMFSIIWYFYLILPLINGLATSVMLETAILMRGQMNFNNALSTAFGMSFISMLMMEIAMEITDLLFTQGELGMNLIAIPFMLVVGFLTPWPYNYWRLKKYGVACH